jgi:Tol biopolymer transport system component
MFRRALAVSLLVALPSAVYGAPGDTTAISYSPVLDRVVDGFDYAVSASGRYAAFSTYEPVTKPGQPSGGAQVYVRDRLSGTYELVSHSPLGEYANGWCDASDISADGRFVVMSCNDATNMFVNDSRPAGLVVRDRVSGTLQRVAFNGGWGAISSDGRYVVFGTTRPLSAGDTNNQADIYLWDRQTLRTERVSVGADEWSRDPDVSDDGRFVSFTSLATNLVPGDTNGASDVFVRDRLTRQTRRVSVSSDGRQGNGASGWSSVISANGRVVAFSSYADNLVPGDRNDAPDYLVHELTSGQTERVNVSSSGLPARGDGEATHVSVSGDGRYVAFSSRAANLVPNDTNNRRDVFVRDRVARTTVRASVSPTGVQGNGSSDTPVISRNGTTVLFNSAATNLIPDPSGFAIGVYAHERKDARSLPVSLTPSTIKFGGIPVGSTSGVRILTISNTSGKSVTIEAINIGGPSPTEFSRVRRCPSELPSGASCTVELRFAPTIAGPSTAKVIVNLGTTYPKGYAWLNGTGL